MTREYVALAFIKEVRGTVEELIKKEGGSIKLERLEHLLKGHYSYPVKGTVVSEVQVNENPQLRAQREKLLRYKDGVVYLN